MRKVYVIFEKDGHGGEQIGGIFESFDDAQMMIDNGGYFDRVECHEVVASQQARCWEQDDRCNDCPVDYPQKLCPYYRPA
jgi:hypothetical protein